MDSSSSSHHTNTSTTSWLSFSLSNNLFETFNPSNSSAAASPKLEDFLGGGANGSSSAGDGAGEAYHNHHPLLLGTDTYDSELKSIAAGFLCGYSGEQAESQTQLAVVAPNTPPAKKAAESFGQRTSIYRGVTRHRWTGRYEAHLWDNTCRREGQSRKGRQVYLGGYDKEDKAARAYDLAALKYWGRSTTTNFPVCNYEREIEEMRNMTRQEFVASLRRKSSGFSRGASMYRGVTRHHQHGRWQARIGRVAGNKDLYLGTFSTQEEAAEAYDIAAIKFRGLNAVTNFDISRYDVKGIATSNLPVGANKPTKASSDTLSANKSSDERGSPSPATPVSFHQSPVSSLTATDFWSSLGYHNTSSLNSCAKAIPIFRNPSSHFTLEMPVPVSTECENSIDGYFSSTITATSTEGYFHTSDQNMSGTSPNAESTSHGEDVTRIGLSSNGNACDGTASFGNWVSPNLHQLQSAKPSLSVFQTPIFGME